MKAKTIALLGVAAGLALSSCGSKKELSLYSWYNYENATYNYSKTPSDENYAKLVNQYNALVQSQGGSRGVVQPGMLAEFGYVLCKKGKVQEGIEYLKKEIATYPESAPYVSKIIKSFEK